MNIEWGEFDVIHQRIVKVTVSLQKFSIYEKKCINK